MRLFDSDLLFSYLERIAVAVEARMQRPESTIELIDRAIGLLHRVGFNRRRVSEIIGVPESTMRGKEWAPFNKVLREGRSMERGLDVARMRQSSTDEEGIE